MDEEFKYVAVPRPDIRMSRQHKRGAPLGMKVWRSMTINFDLLQTIEHVVIACPNYKLTERGPVFDFKTKEAEKAEGV